MFTLVTARTLRCPPYRERLLKCFRPFVASWPAPSASGRSESGRVGIAPTERVHLSQGTHNNPVERGIRPTKLGLNYARRPIMPGRGAIARSVHCHRRVRTFESRSAHADGIWCSRSVAVHEPCIITGRSRTA